MKLANRNAVITGGSRGLGRAIVEGFLAEGASVLTCSRSAADLRKLEEDLRPLLTPQQNLNTLVVDVGREDSAERLRIAAHECFAHTDIVVTNAGVYGPFGTLDRVDWDEWLESLQINLFGTVRTCRAFLPDLKECHRGKIIALSGGGATSPLPRLSAYAAGKAGVVRFMETLAHEVREYGIDVNSVAPGPLNTRFVDQVIAAGPERVGDAFYQRALKQKRKGGAPLKLGARLCVFLASAESNGITGRLISAIWDPWERLAELRGDLEQSDIYTLRRIVPEDRGKHWPARNS